MYVNMKGDIPIREKANEFLSIVHALREILIRNLQEEINLSREKHRHVRKNKEP